eukprot:scaffold40595_cov15-Prasinocladus_malaysianus.AAC.1
MLEKDPSGQWQELLANNKKRQVGMLLTHYNMEKSYMFLHGKHLSGDARIFAAFLHCQPI